MKVRSNNVGFPIIIGVNLLVTGSQFGIQNIKFDVWRSKFHFCKIEDFDIIRVKLQAILFKFYFNIIYWL